MRSFVLIAVFAVSACTPKGDATTGDATTGDGPGETGEPTGGGSVDCAAYCAHQVACDTSEAADCDEVCANGKIAYGYPGASCLAAFDASLACELAASCEALAQPDVCKAERDALETEVCVSPVCGAYADKLVECGGAAELRLSNAKECSFRVGQLSVVPGTAACVAAAEAQYDCVAALTCEQLEDPEDCSDEADAVDMMCV